MTKPVLIVGGGIGGMTLAALLRRRGRGCVVLERAARFAPVGAGIVLQPNAVKALRIGGIDQAVVGRGAAMQRMQIRADGGRILSEIQASSFETAFNASVTGFHRATLHAALLDLVEPGSIRLGAGVTACAASPDAAFVELETGERIEGSAVVGADGLRSAVRRTLLKDGEPVYAGYTSWRGITNRGSLWPAGQMCESWGRGARFGLVAIDSDRLYWFATANTAPGETDRGKDALLARFGGWHEPIRAVIESTPPDAILRTDIADREPISRWSEGRMTLLGDAAHPMTPNLGQGGCQAIEDAVVLDLCLSATEDVAAAFKDYEVRRRERAARVVREARRFGKLGQLENSVVRALRDFAVGMTPLSATLRTVRWLYDFDI